MSPENNNELVEYKDENNGSSFKSILGKIFSFLFICYMYTMFVAVPWMNWNYARENGFMKWLIFGEIVATAKGFIWPYYAYNKYMKKADIRQANVKKDKQAEWDHNTEMLAYTVTGSWMAIDNPEAAKQLPDMMAFQKNWVSTLSPDKKDELLNAITAFELAWLELGENITENPKSLFDGTCFNSPMIEEYKNEFKHVTGIRNAWDRGARFQAVEAAKFKVKGDLSDEETAKMYAALAPVFEVLMKQGQERMDETIDTIFNP